MQTTCQHARRTQWISLQSMVTSPLFDGCMKTVPQGIPLAPCNALQRMGIYLNIVKWLHENRLELQDTHLMDGAVKNGRLFFAVAQWFYENHTEGCSSGAVTFAAGYGHVQIVEWVFEQYPSTVDSFSMEKAVIWMLTNDSTRPSRSIVGMGQ
jgi:hypothetical protein